MGDAVTALDRAQVAIALAALALLVPGCALAARGCARAWRELPRAERRVALAAALVGALLRLGAPKRIVTVFLGYAATQRAIDLVPVPRHGAGATVTHALWLALFGHDHRVILWGNAVVGAAALPLWVAVLRRRMNAPWVAAAGAWVLSLTPMFVRNDASDSNNVAALALTAVALLAHGEASGPAGWRALAVAPAAALATMSRPDFLAFVPLAFALAGAWSGGWRIPWGAAALAHAAHVVRAAAEMHGRGSLPIARSLLAAPMGLIGECALWTPTQFPIGLTALAAWAALRGDLSQRATARRLWAASLLALLCTSADLATANAARVHVPGALLLVPAMASAAVTLWGRAGRGGRALLAAALLATALPSAWGLFHTVNDDHEEALIRDAVARLPRGRFTLLRLGHDDRYPEFDRGRFVHYEFPDYLLRGDGREGRASALAPFLAAPDLGGPVYFFHGVRCHARGRDDDAPPPRGAQLHPACAAMHEGFALAPVIERVVRNEGDDAFPWYPAAPTFRVGLYRVVTARRRSPR